MKTKRKNGFTIVELVIVIAVIAILAAILVPTISKLVKKAHVTSDTQLVRNLNTSLAMDTQNPKHANMQSALDAAAKNGFDVAKINAAALDNMILWDSENDVFCYRMVNEDGSISISYIPESVEAGKELDADSYKLWIISDQVHPNFSTYYTGTATTINTSKGFDAGNNTSIQTITYTNSENQDVVIRTNSANTALVIDDTSTGSIAHYGSTGSLKIIQCHTGSYHEKGKVGFAEIAKGRIVLESGADVNQIHVNKKTSEEAFDEVIIAFDQSVDFENVDLSRDDVQINETTGTLVVALQAGTAAGAEKDYVWLTKQGVYEQIKISDSSANAGSTWADDNSNSTTTQEAAKQIANNIGRNENGDVDVTVTVDTTTYTVSVDPVTRELVAKDDGDNVVSTEEVVTAVKNEVEESGLDSTAKEEAKAEVVETAQNVETLEKAEDSGYEITHFDALAPTCTEAGHTAYDSYYVNAEEVKVGYKEIAALGHNTDMNTGVCSVCEAQVYVAKIGDVGYATLQSAWNVGANKMIVLLSNLTQNAYYAYGTYTLDLNGHTLEMRGHSAVSGAFGTDGGANGDHTNLTIKNGTLNLTGAGYNTYGIFNYGTLTLKDLTVNSACQTVIYSIGQQWGSAGTTTLDNVTINSTHNSGTAVAAYAYKNSWGNTVVPGVVIKDSSVSAANNAVMMYAVDATVENCEITATGNNALWISNSATGSGITGTVTVKGNTTITAGSDYKRLNAQNSNSIVIIEGTYNFDPSNNNGKNYVDGNSFDIAEDNGVWTVTAK